MTKTFHRIFIRPSLEIDFPEDPPEFTQYMIDTYVKTEKCLEHRTTEYSVDKLIKFSISVWKNSEIFDDSLSDPKLSENQHFLMEYCQEHGISTNVWIE